MKYSQNLVWKAVYEFCPTYKVARDSKIHINLTQALRDAAILAFIECGNNSIASLGTDRSYAALILQDTLKELGDKGSMTFGTQENYWE